MWNAITISSMKFLVDTSVSHNTWQKSLSKFLYRWHFKTKLIYLLKILFPNCLIICLFLWPPLHVRWIDHWLISVKSAGLSVAAWPNLHTYSNKLLLSPFPCALLLEPFLHFAFSVGLDDPCIESKAVCSKAQGTKYCIFMILPCHQL